MSESMIVLPPTATSLLLLKELESMPTCCHDPASHLSSIPTLLKPP